MIIQSFVASVCAEGEWDRFGICDNKLVCNRYRLTHTKQYLAERFEAWDEIEERPRYNIAPTQPVLTVRKEQGKKSRKFTTMRWELIPSWAKDMSIATRTLNARSKTVTTTPAFRQSIQTKRCLIPADGFYEWQKMGSVKQPYCFEVGEGELFAFAGLWDQWKNPEGQIIESCTILTTTPNSLVADMHDRMPVIVPPDKYDLWLEPYVRDFTLCLVVVSFGSILLATVSSSNNGNFRCSLHYSLAAYPVA